MQKIFEKQYALQLNCQRKSIVVMQIRKNIYMIKTKRPQTVSNTTNIQKLSMTYPVIFKFLWNDWCFSQRPTDIPRGKQ